MGMMKRVAGMLAALSLTAILASPTANAGSGCLAVFNTAYADSQTPALRAINLLRKFFAPTTPS